MNTFHVYAVNVSTQLNPNGIAGLLQLLAPLPPPPPPPADNQTTGLSHDALAGIVVACVAVVLVMSAVSAVLFAVRWKKEKRSKLL